MTEGRARARFAENQETVAETRARRSVRRPISIGVLDQHLGYFVRRLQIAIFQDFDRTLASVDLKPAQYSVLVVIGANPGLSQSDVADTLGIERARLVHVLDLLEKRGLLERLPSPVDRRSHAVHLTRKGETTLDRSKALAANHEKRLTEALGFDTHQAMIRALRNHKM